MDTDKNFFIQLVIGVYKVTKMFPEKEPLKILIRKRANLVLTDLILLSSDSALNEKILVQRVLENIAILCSYFEISDEQNWIDKRNFLVLKANYDKIRNKVRKRVFVEIDSTRGIKRENKDNNKNFSKKIASIPNSKEIEFNKKISIKRQEKIIEILKTNKIISSKELSKKFPGISVRTLRRDISCLIENNIVAKQGNSKTTLYKLNQIKEAYNQNLV